MPQPRHGEGKVVPWIGPFASRKSGGRNSLPQLEVLGSWVTVGSGIHSAFGFRVRVGIVLPEDGAHQSMV